MGDTLNGAEALVRMLEKYEVKHIFGLCGDTSLPFYDALARLNHGMQHILTRDERSAGYMADAYARVTHKVGVCEGPSGGGATYLLPGLVEANESSIPVLGITSDVPVTSRGKYPLTELDQQALYKPLTKWNTTIDLAEQIPSAIRTAFKAMTTGKPGSAHICLPHDVQKHSVLQSDIWAQKEHCQYPAQRYIANNADIEKAAQMLLQAKFPVLICGGGVINSGAEQVLEKIAQLLNIPVCTTVSGQGSLAGNHPLNAGVVGANGGVMATRDLVNSADLVFFITCRAGSTTTENWRYPNKSIPIIHLDINPETIGANYPTAVGLVGDAKLTLEQIYDYLVSNIQARTHNFVDGKAVVAKAKLLKFESFLELANSNETPILPERIVHTLNRLLPKDAIVCADPGTPCPYFSAYFMSDVSGRHFITNRAHGALGFAMSAAIGAAVGRPNSLCVAVMGDGSFGFTVGELETITRYKLPLLMIVISNSVYGWIKASQKSGYDKRYFSVDFNRTNHAKVAEAYGVRSWTVDDPTKLDAVIKAAIESGEPALVDIISQPLQDAAAPVSQWMG
ncbi:thiamine pyrophosphate-binding protein [Polynucleobacter sp. AP-Titi-500A-B4]|uniref:thiamine pyrophosphate-binding protein n=1 Tax=Polynucleobacter sp. AP-Titi-500A-B4 TaxID=2576923 RepID=UPI001BFE6B36|nr:thiamine pyrophosphate-binding protein [Polynucleobacter sp. AP-Titi-500A-B4]QWE11977.1 thiamine pyrophosphate-binding protein [Polynucleobacter sp. AP-Titi-500A-B4]